MATAAIEPIQTDTASSGETCFSKTASSKQGEGLRQYYLQHIHDLQLQVRQKTHNLNRLEAQRNDLNSKGTYLGIDINATINPSFLNLLAMWVMFVNFSDTFWNFLALCEVYGLFHGSPFFLQLLSTKTGETL